MKRPQIQRTEKTKQPSSGKAQGFRVKKAKMLRMSRGMLDKVNPQNAATILNTIYSVSPVAFDPPQIQKKIRTLFPAGDRKLDLETLNLMRLYRKSQACKIAVCCMPKSGSTYVMTSLKRLEQMNLHIGYLHVPYTNPSFVDAVPNENEIDELALLCIEMMNRNTVVQTHTKNSPYTENLLGTHGYKTIVVQRNIFDCIVSMDDMVLSYDQFVGFGMFHPPAGYNTLPRKDRLAFLTQYVGPWYIDFIVSWQRTRLKPVFLNYDEDILQFDETTAEKIRSGLKLEDITISEMMNAFQLKTSEHKNVARLNKGISRRGEDIPQYARDAIRRLADVYAKDIDFTGLI